MSLFMLFILLYSEHSLCERQRAEAERARLLAAEHAEAIHVMECEEDGSFKPLQCQHLHEVSTLVWCLIDH